MAFERRSFVGQVRTVRSSGQGTKPASPQRNNCLILTHHVLVGVRFVNLLNPVLKIMACANVVVPMLLLLAVLVHSNSCGAPLVTAVLRCVQCPGVAVAAAAYCSSCCIHACNQNLLVHMISTNTNATGRFMHPICSFCRNAAPSVLDTGVED